ncbi:MULTISPECIES: YitT family protein [Clostridium]|uniref:YitT family protein n=1 Tax=Clostridium aquiflavi TaxID=3073603 RepID=A0ABU1EJP9_9CLOT|nr:MULTISPECIES: YitT family protein [unclassified Clostridium]MDR5588463.1 YitT family protein [Clostridium sp. 5N-1]NFG63299.1 YitT family protein [Clostridium botulinum]NFQ08782.1 YitT family protein [Clostridium botulinum]
MKNKYNNVLSIISRIFFMILGSILVSIGLEIFLIPNNIIDGGMTGISIMASHLTKAELGIFIFVFNLPFVIVGYKQIGKTFALSTIFSVICLSTGVTLLHPVPGITQDILLATIFGGIIMGVGVGLIIRNGGSLDGTEIVAIIIEKRSIFSIGEIVMFFNFFILGSSGFIFGWDRAMYSLIAYFIAFKTIDITVEGLNESKAVIIVSEKNKEISDAIIARLGRGITFLDGKGAYSGNKTDVIYVVLSRLEVAKLKKIVHGFDEEALITISSVEGTGKSYKKKAIH